MVSTYLGNIVRSPACPTAQHHILSATFIVLYPLCWDLRYSTAQNKEQCAWGLRVWSSTLPCLDHLFLFLYRFLPNLLPKYLAIRIVFYELYLKIIYLEYGNAVWGPFNRADQVAVEKVQRRATKLVRNIRHRPYTERLKLLNLPSLYYRRRRGDMILVYQIFHAGIDVHPEVFFDRATHSVTRGHEWKLMKPWAESRVRRNAFATRVVNDWNSLPPSIVNASSVNAFKSNLDAHWAEMIFATPYQDQ